MTQSEKWCIKNMLLEPAIQAVRQLKVLLPIVVKARQGSKMSNRIDNHSVYDHADRNGAKDDENIVGKEQIIRRDCGLHRW